MYDSCEPRTVAFDNDIFNFFLKTPVEFRFNGRLSKKTLKIINSQFANIISAKLSEKNFLNLLKLRYILRLNNILKTIINSISLLNFGY